MVRFHPSQGPIEKATRNHLERGDEPQRVKLYREHRLDTEIAFFNCLRAEPSYFREKCHFITVFTL